MKSILQTLTYKGIYGIVYTASLMPLTLLYSIASFAYFLSYHVIGYRKTVVIQNISRSFPDMKYGEIHCVVKKFYSCFTAYFAEILKSVSAPVDILGKRITFDNLALIDKHIEAGRNVIACMGHCGNWEMLNIMPYKLHHEVYAVYKPLRSEVMNKLMIKLRSRFGLKLITDKSVVRHFFTKKSTPSVYLFLADQCPRIKEEKYKFELLNQNTYIFSGMEKLAHTSKSAVVYLYITQLSKGNYRVMCAPICDEAETMRKGEISSKYIELLTQNIKDEPYGWLWSHRRWKV